MNADLQKSQNPNHKFQTSTNCDICDNLCPQPYKKMKIAIVSHNIVKKGDGQGKANYEFVNYLMNKGYEVDLYANRVEPNLKGKVVFHPIRVIQRPLILKTPMFLIIASLKLFYRKYDIIYTDSGNYLGYYDFIGCHFCHKRYLRYKMRFYDRIYEIFNSWIERLEYKREGIIIAVSKCLKRELMEEFRIPSDRIKVVYNGAEIQKRAEEHGDRGADEKTQKPELGGQFSILFVGDLSYRKGLDFLIDVMRGMDKNIRLLIAGKPRRKYIKLANGLQVEFLGFKSNIYEILREVDGLILPSIYDPFGIVVLEAMAAGVPPIVSSRAGVSELIQDMEDGIIIKDPTNINEIIEKINLLASNPELRKKIREKALATVKNYTWEKMAEEKERII